MTIANPGTPAHFLSHTHQDFSTPGVIAMAARKTLRAVAPDEKPARAKTITEAADSGTQRELLAAMRGRIAKAVEDSATPARDLAALSRRLLEIAREIEAIDSRAGGDDLGDAADTPDTKFDPTAL